MRRTPPSRPATAPRREVPRPVTAVSRDSAVAERRRRMVIDSLESFEPPASWGRHDQITFQACYMERPSFQVYMNWLVKGEKPNRPSTAPAHPFRRSNNAQYQENASIWDLPKSPPSWLHNVDRADSGASKAKWDLWTSKNPYRRVTFKTKH
eukprot:GEMP01050909.1.p1 GENE.GEMP01050909.1~~GEMP01050909.1.p1  ORF type:complete len:152 (+),score=31.86 GEMP01050909.1:323-778(+)